MKHKHEAWAEQAHEPSKAVFDLEQMEPIQVANLVAILGKELSAEDEVKDEDPKQKGGRAIVIHDLLEHDIANLPKRDLEKAHDLYVTMATSRDGWTRAVIACHMGDLLRHLLDDNKTRQQIIDLWVKLMCDKDQYVQEFARDAISEVVDENWLDEPTSRYLNSKLPEVWRSEISGSGE